MSGGRKPLPADEYLSQLRARFWRSVRKTRACWLWQKSLFRTGYGQISMRQKIGGRRETRAHRVAWFLVYGKWPSKGVCHTCDVKSCVRPSHLFEGDQKANIRDAVRKGRFNDRFPVGYFDTLSQVGGNARWANVSKEERQKFMAALRAKRIYTGKSRLPDATQDHVKRTPTTRRT